jgi:hypothetical protein
MCIPRSGWKQNTGMEKSFNKATKVGRVDINGKAEKEERKGDIGLTRQ